MDVSHAIIPKSDQLNADDLISGPRTFTITDTTAGNAEQPVNIHLDGARPFRPSKSMLRVLVAVYGSDSTTWVGQSLTLYRDPHVKWAGQEVGGIRISHMTGIDKPLRMALTETKGKRALFNVQPLKVEKAKPAPEPTEPTEADVTACIDVDELKAMWRRSGPERRAQIEQRVTDLQNEPEPGDDA